MYVQIPRRLLPCNIRLLLPREDFHAFGTRAPSRAVMPSVSEGSVCREAAADALRVGMPEPHYTESAGAFRGRPAVIKTASLESHPYAADEVLAEVSNTP